MLSGSSTLVEEAAWTPGEVLFGVCVVEKLLGEGGMGRVYRVFHHGWDMHVVVKVPRPEVIADVTGSLMFERECQTWVNLGLHPHIVTSYIVRRLDDVPLVFAEYVSGGSLSDWIRTKRIYKGDENEALARILDVAIQFAWGLHYAHEQGLVHQDVKSANVMITDDETVKVTDFGLAKAGPRDPGRKPYAGANPPASSGGMTPAYASPEQMNKQPLDRRTDIWSWAVSILEIFVGSVVWRVGTAAPAVLDDYCAQLKEGKRSRRPAMPKELAKLLRHCLSAHPDDRPDDMTRVANRLIDIYSESTGRIYERSMPAMSKEYGDSLHVGSLNNSAISMIELEKSDKALELLKDAELTAKMSFSPEGLAALQEITYNHALLQIRTNPMFDSRNVASLIPETPDRVKHAFYTGMLHLEAGNLEEAATLLLEVVRSSKRFRIDALKIRGICLLLSGEIRPAILSFREALHQAPNRADALRNLALAYYYDGQFVRSFSTFTRYARSNRLDSEDAIAYAAILSSVGLTDAAARYVTQVLEGSQRPASVLLSSAEIVGGVQTFLPGVNPVSGTGGYPRALVSEALDSAPNNLRACVDYATSGRQGARFLKRIRKKERERPQTPDPVRVAHFAFASYRPLVGAARWGVLSEKSYLYRAMSLAAVVPLIFATVYWPRLLSPEAIQSGFATTSEGFVHAVRIMLWTALVFVLVRPISPKRLSTDVLLGCGAVLWLLYLPSMAHHYFVDPFSDTPVPIIDPRHRQILGNVFLALAFPLVARELGFRFFSTRFRAFGSWKPSRFDDAASDDTSTLSRSPFARSGVGPGPEKASPRFDVPSVTPAGVLWRWGLSAWSRSAPRVQRSYRRVVSNFGVWQCYLVPEFIALAALDTICYQSARTAEIGKYFLLMLASHLVLLAYAAVVPRLFIVANTALCLLIGLHTSTLYFSDAGLYRALLFGAVSAPLLFANWRAYLRCPGVAPLWTSFKDPLWDVSPMVDPLNARRFATPWKVIRIKSSGRQESDLSSFDNMMY